MLPVIGVIVILTWMIQYRVTSPVVLNDLYPYNFINALLNPTKLGSVMKGHVRKGMQHLKSLNGLQMIQ